MNKIFFILLLSIIFIISCKKIIPPIPTDAEALEGPITGLTSEEHQQFLKGDAVFGEIFTTATGLGPIFVSNSCASCHSIDGKGHPSNALIRFGQTDELGNLFLNQGGPQIQNKAIPGYSPEILPSNTSFTKLIAPAIVGLGYFHFVTDATILAQSDPDDLDGDGVSGRPNWITIPSYLTVRNDAILMNGKYIGRFGKKASVYDLRHQIVNALNQDIGITSTFHPIDLFSNQETDPEISNQKINDLTFYISTLKAPSQRNKADSKVIRGEEIFNQIQCISCHKPTLQTGYSPIKALSNIEFHPYTDLLLHDMGYNLDDNYTEGIAYTSEWRTAPLWGLGLAKKSQGGQYFLLHDGRAHSIEEAILFHGGEAYTRKMMYKALADEDKKALIQFLESL
ncbi:MAG: thiol oxidoreductase [Flavobacteriia bacterium]|nr:thiol oxidoreductase [Flavobacteriia bacterium]